MPSIVLCDGCKQKNKPLLGKSVYLPKNGSNDTRTMIITLFRKGLNRKAIAEKLGVSEAWCYLVMRQAIRDWH